MPKDFTQIEWNEEVEDDCRQIVRLAIREDLARAMDWTTVGLVPADAQGTAAVVARDSGVICGLEAAKCAIEEMNAGITWTAASKDGDTVEQDQHVATIAGPARGMLTAERILLNLIGRLSGVATLAARFVAAVEGTSARIYDTRKTTPGWRRLEKYASRCGGAHNHRSGLFDAVLIKDNHLAFGDQSHRFTPAEAVVQCRDLLADQFGEETADATIVEIEVDVLAQLDTVLRAEPDIVLLDNMSCDELRIAVATRDQTAPDVQLEASGGISLEIVGEIARTGVERISVGAMTHSASSFDVGLDWQ